MNPDAVSAAALFTSLFAWLLMGAWVSLVGNDENRYAGDVRRWKRNRKP